MNRKIKIILIIALILAAGFALWAYFNKEEAATSNDPTAVTYCWDLKDGWQIKLSATWENNYIAEKVTTDQGNLTTFYYAPKGKKTQDKLMSIGVMDKDKWAAIAEASRPGTFLEERDGSVYYIVYPAKAESWAKLYKQMFTEAKDLKFQTIKKTPNLPDSIKQPIMGSSGSSATGTTDTTGTAK